MPNQYTNPLIVNHENTYTSQHVGLPLEAMEAALQARQRGYDNIENIGIQTQTHLGGIEGYGDYANKYLTDKKKELDDFVSKYDGKDLTSPNISKAFKQKANDIAQDGELADIQQKATLVKQFKANISDMRKSGDLYDENIYHHMRALDNYSKTGSFGDGDFDPSIDKGVNIEEEAEKYYKALHADSAETIRKIADGAGGSLYYDQSGGGISGAKIQGQAGRVFGEFSKSQAGKQLARRYDMETNGKGSEKGKVQYMANMFLKAGQGFQYSESKSNMSAALDKKEDLKRAKKAALESIEVPFVEAGSTASHIPLGKDGLPEKSGGMWEAMTQTIQNGGDWKSAIKNGYKEMISGNGVYTEADKKRDLPHMDAIDVINKQRVKDKQPLLTPTEYFQARQNQAEKRSQLVSNIPIDSKTLKAYKDAFLNGDGKGGSIMALPAIDPNGDPSDRSQTVDSVVRKMLGKGKNDPITEEDWKDHNIQMSGVPAKSGYSPRGINIFVDGKPIIADAGFHMLSKGYIPKNAEEAKELNEFNASQAENGKGSHVFDGYIPDGNKITSKRVKAIYDPTTGKSIIKEAN